MKLHFTKMHGCGNDYIYLDQRGGLRDDIPELARRLSRRHLSIGADGVICISAPVTPGADARMEMFNADGSRGVMCGNGIRCVAQWLRDHGCEKEVLHIDTDDGVKLLRWQGDGRWQVEMGKARFLPEQIPCRGLGDGPVVGRTLNVDGKDWTVTCVSMGNPHCVTRVDNVDDLDLEKIGPSFEHHVAFPDRVNTEFIQVLNPTQLRMRVWERGSGETLACGTGTCAAVAAMCALGVCEKGSNVQVQLRGGTLTIRVTDEGILMTGPAETAYEGDVEV